ncbi:MAG TPA: transporter, partial [Roseiarcus sp.]|nr:transporter [Roseiarcus sp.]
MKSNNFGGGTPETGGGRAGALVVAMAAMAAAIAEPDCARADEGGVGFWLPGQLGTLAAVPQTPGWNVGIIDYYTSVSAGGKVAAARQVTLSGLPRNVFVDLNANLHARANLGVVSPGYVFATPVLGGQLAVSMAAIGGWSSADISGTLTVAKPPFTATRQGEMSDSRFGIGDLYPFAALRWNSGVNNWMTFLDGDIPVGMYDSSRLANFGIGHGSVDGGGGYTYFDPQTGHEFSLTTGLTYNLSNSSTDYRNGWDWHLDWGVSQFLSKTIQVGAVGYVYAQLTGDHGAAQFLGANLSRVAAVGPQVAFIFPGQTIQTYLNF